MQPQPMNIQTGFTLIEILIVIAIGGIILTAGTARYTEFNRRQTMVAAGQTLKNNLRDIQTKAQFGVKPDVANCNSPNYLLGYEVSKVNSTNYQAEAICYVEGSGPVDSGVITTYTMPSGVYLETFDTFQFLVLGRGTGTSDNTIDIENAITSPTRGYQLCVFIGGEIKDCGYWTGSEPTCTCLEIGLKPLPVTLN